MPLQIKEAITKLSPKKDDVIVIKHTGALDPAEVQRLANALKGRGIEALLMFVEDDSDIFVLNEAGMAEFGWYRKREQP